MAQFYYCFIQDFGFCYGTKNQNDENIKTICLDK